MAKLKLECLLDLGGEKLAQFLMEMAQRDEVLKKRLLMMTASDSERLKKIRSQISGLKRTKRFYDWRSVRKLREKVELTIQAIGQLKIEPQKGFELVASFYETDNAVYGNCDDSSGMIADLYRFGARNLLIQFGNQCDDKNWLTEKIAELNQHNDYGVRDGILTAACEFLPEADIRKLIGRYCELAADEDEKSKTAKEEEWDRASRRYWSAAEELARGIKDGPLHEMALRSSWAGHFLNSAAWNDIAEVYLDAGDPETALDRLGNIDDEDNFRRHETERLRIAAHTAIGNTDEVVNILQKRLLASPSSKTLAKLEAFVKPVERQSIVDGLVSTYIKSSQLDLSFLEFALDKLKASLAEQYLLERAGQIDGEQYHYLAPIAKQCVEKNLPLAATLVLRALADSILARGASKNYKIAVGYINRASKLVVAIGDWQNHSDHDAYLESLRTAHARKTAFWSKMD